MSVVFITGYVTDPTQKIRGLSPLHDSGTGSSLGVVPFSMSPFSSLIHTMGVSRTQEPMVLSKLCPFCVPKVSALVTRLSKHEKGSGRITQMWDFLSSYDELFANRPLQVASPGYFAQTLDNDILMEATSTRRAGLERFTFPKGSKPYFVLDLSNDLPASFAGGTMDIDPVKGRVTMGGIWGSRYDMHNSLLRYYLCTRHML